MMSAPSEILIRITSSYGLRIKTEIPRMYDEARVLAPETARLWQDLLSVDIERADMVLVIDLGCGPSSLIRCVIREVPRTIDEKTARIGGLAWTSCDERIGVCTPRR
jgi:hypothetical protein